jgi:hypothetical protein
MPGDLWINQRVSQAKASMWSRVHVDPEGQVLLLFLPPQSPFPIDGIRFQDQEVKYTMPVGSTRVSALQDDDTEARSESIQELEVHEVKYGFIPGSQDTNAWRVRRRYRLNKGGHPQLVLVHYCRGPQIR